MTLAEHYEVLKAIRLKFTSGNDIPVERATITAEEWKAIEKYLGDLYDELESLGRFE